MNRHPDLEGCVAVGETREEALANLEEARRLWLETAYEYGDEIPFCGLFSAVCTSPRVLPPRGMGNLALSKEGSPPPGFLFQPEDLHHPGGLQKLRPVAGLPRLEGLAHRAEDGHGKPVFPFHEEPQVVSSHRPPDGPAQVLPQAHQGFLDPGGEELPRLHLVPVGIVEALKLGALQDTLQPTSSLLRLVM
jgi:Uncharacterized conserved protein, COG1598